jgi:hypothetical protein
MEWSIPYVYILCERLERWRILHRGIWSQVSILNSRSPLHRNLTFLLQRFERELEALRKELADSSNNTSSSRSGRSSPTFTDGESLAGTPLLMVQPLPAASLDELLAEVESPDKDKDQ